MNLDRIAGVCYVLTFASIPTLALYQPVHDAGFVTGTGSVNGVVIGAVLELVVALACLGTAVALYPVLKGRAPARALGFVGARVLEATAIFLGVACLLALVALRRDGTGTVGTVGTDTGRVLVALYDSIFLVSQGFVPAVNAVLLGTVLYRFRLVPRALPVLGLIGAALLVVSDAGVLFGAWDRLSPVAGVAALPIAVWEFLLGVYLIVNGLRRSGLEPVAHAGLGDQVAGVGRVGL
ncbi:DUF4386 domain-containing protein [Cryptosporangium phraense]|uniref:DUF4386 domain-containing protein n=1 Tax=Cryptosporangium phraense TaxID=2593070 RepID=A0A545AIX3_9ACTN|nr:DUF4386 domain-containing protein [Cryptosporangium phraense]TQS41274.1 DUF4386 domain-containing protein [Cryptosporangium phraense]